MEDLDPDDPARSVLEDPDRFGAVMERGLSAIRAVAGAFFEALNERPPQLVA